VFGKHIEFSQHDPRVVRNKHHETSSTTKGSIFLTIAAYRRYATFGCGTRRTHQLGGQHASRSRLWVTPVINSGFYSPSQRGASSSRLVHLAIVIFVLVTRAEAFVHIFSLTFVCVPYSASQVKLVTIAHATWRSCWQSIA